ncbi:hypothetical protein ALC57_11263 [Trachymyrmex cornetzi]|uniref:Uncharacterized protein n=1 Tax=Trachymyrmex cornetzi TaxID=471704 RepID=A0A195DU36_9HYME|nr:hypothetical protein ALC57_11263 [Trachymyrmex cornetzi]
MLRASREGSRGAPAGAGAGAAPDEDNASLPLSYEPGPAIINSSKHSFSYTQLYVVLSPTKRSPPMSFSMPAMVLIAGVSSVARWTRSLTIYGRVRDRRASRQCDAPIYRDLLRGTWSFAMNINMAEVLKTVGSKVNFHDIFTDILYFLDDESENSDKRAISALQNVAENRFRQAIRYTRFTSDRSGFSFRSLSESSFGCIIALECSVMGVGINVGKLIERIVTEDDAYAEGSDPLPVPSCLDAVSCLSLSHTVWVGSSVMAVSRNIFPLDTPWTSYTGRSLGLVG